MKSRPPERYITKITSTMNKKINNPELSVSKLEETAEGLLRGGFAVIGGGGTASPLDLNEDCNNEGCNSGTCGHTNIGYCRNKTCNNGCAAPTTKPTEGDVSSIGLTFSL